MVWFPRIDHTRFLKTFQGSLVKTEADSLGLYGALNEYRGFPQSIAGCYGANKGVSTRVTQVRIGYGPP